MKTFFQYFLALMLLGIVLIAVLYYPRLDLITGFAAKNVCSCTFEAERDLASVELEDNDFEPVSYAENKVNSDESSAVSTFFGLKKRKAVYDKGLGCTLLPPDAESYERVVHRPRRKALTSKAAFPYGNNSPKDSVFSNVNYRLLETAVNEAFDKPGKKAKRTRAVLVLYKDHLIAEKYAPGFSSQTKFLGWSMTKSVTNAVLGTLVKEGRISLDQDHLFPEWEKDARSKITLRNLLHMNSGLEWEEDYTEISDVTKMLFLADDMAAVQLHKPLVGKAGASWNYSSGTTNLLSGFIRDRFETHQEYLDYWYTNLIDKIGMNSMTVETDLEGNYVGSSYAWATARDWAKFGRLYLHKGNWNGEQVLDEDWVKFSATPTTGSKGEYGGHFWLNAGGKYPNVPKDMFSSNGFQGQYVFIIPSEDIVVVRLGLVEDPEFSIDHFLKNILAAIE